MISNTEMLFKHGMFGIKINIYKSPLGAATNNVRPMFASHLNIFIHKREGIVVDRVTGNQKFTVLKFN